MIYNLEVGDLVTGSPPCQRGLHDAMGTATLSATPKSTPYLLLRLPRSSIMTVVEPPSQSATSTWPPQTARVTVLLDGQLFDVFLNDVERVESVQQ